MGPPRVVLHSPARRADMHLTGQTPREIAFIERLATGFARSPLQCNARHESDAELIRLPGYGVLALTTDAIVEEIETGLYDDPFLIGWMTVTVNASDLSAVGAAPIGILINQTLPPDWSAADLTGLQRGIAAACETYGLPVLGGDTNSGRLHLSGCAVGAIVDGLPMTRRGAKRGDHLLASGPLGIGGAYALSRTTRRPGSTVRYRPRARLAEGQLLRRFASACMDTSDGAIPTLDELGRLNDVGFELDSTVRMIVDTDALTVTDRAGLPAWLLLAGPHGEFELLFTIPEEHLTEFTEAAARVKWQPVALGRVVEPPGLRFSDWDRGRVVDARRVRDLYGEVAGDVNAYLEALLTMDRAAPITSTS